jgi:hypothetical protein
VEPEEGVELGAEGVVEEGADAGVDEEESVEDEAAGLSEGFAESDFLESEEESVDLDDESLDESLEPELLGA